MKKRLYKLVAMVLVLILALGNDLIMSMAASISGDSITVDTNTGEDYIVSSNADNETTLVVYSGGVVGNISIEADVTHTPVNVQIGAGSEVSQVTGNIDVLVTGEGTPAYGTLVDISNSGTISGTVTTSGYATLTNSGYIGGIQGNGGNGIIFNDGASAGTLNLASGSVTFNGNSVIDSLIMSAGTSASSSGGAFIDIGNSLDIAGTVSSDISFMVQDTTQINTANMQATDTVNIVYEDISYIVPSGIAAKPVSDLVGKFSMTSNALDFNDLYVGYTDQAVSKSTTITNIGSLAYPVEFQCTSTDFIVEGKKGDVTFESGDYLAAGEVLDIVVTPVANLEVGSYTATVSTEFCGNPGIITANLQIVPKLDRVASVTMADYYYGANPSVPAVVSDADDGDTAIFSYLSKEEGALSSEVAPTAVGDYMVTATLPATYMYNETVVQGDFSIVYMEIPDNPVTILGETKNNSGYYTSDVTLTAITGFQMAKQLDGTYEGEFTYKETINSIVIYLKDSVTNAKSDAYMLPTGIKIDKDFPIVDAVDGDTYYVNTLTVDISDDNLSSVSVNGVDQNLESGVTGTSVTLKLQSGLEEFIIIATDIAGNETKKTITLAKHEGTGTVVMEDFYYGETPAQPTVSSSTNGTTGVILEYYRTDLTDETQEAEITTAMPTQVGTYEVRASFPMTDTHQAFSVTDTFSIKYMPVPSEPVTYGGTLGNSSYYTTDVVLKAKSGYMISETLDGTYTESITYNQSKDSVKLYFKNTSTGALSTEYVVSGFSIDKDMPYTSDIENGGTYYGDDINVSINDLDFRYVSVNGELYPITITNGEVLLNLPSNDGMEAYEIVAEDMAGNSIYFAIKVCAQWMRTMIIPADVNVRLDVNTGYNLDDGNWTVSGDSTTYEGGTVFYIGNEGNYVFTKE